MNESTAPREIATITIVRDALLCAVLLALAVFLGYCARIAAVLPDQIIQTRQDVISEVDRRAIDLQGQALDEIDKQATVLQIQIAQARKETLDEVDSIHQDALRAAGMALQEVDAVRTNANDQLTITNFVLARGVGSIAQTASDASDHASYLMDTYAALPANMYASPEWTSIRPEITCRQADGSGYGGCWHSRVTALMGEAAKVGGTFTQKFPQFADSTTGIAKDVHTFTSKAVSPRGFWGNFRDFIGLGSGVTRALGAAGVFDIQAAPGR